MICQTFVLESDYYIDANSLTWKMAINFSIRIIGYAPLQDSIKYREELTTNGYQDMHLGFAFGNASLEISLVTSHGPNEQYGEHPDKPSYILIAGIAHPGMFQLVVTHLKALGTPTKGCSTVLPSTKWRQVPKGANRIGMAGDKCP